nr:HPP family protein [Comamonas jiangduensis]
MAPAARLDVLRVGLGAVLGLAIAAVLVQLALWRGVQGGWALFAPLGATAVLVFAVHTGPLSQPWSCVVGNTVSALWALLVVACLAGAGLAAACGGGRRAVAGMQFTRALHPPGGGGFVAGAGSPARRTPQLELCLLADWSADAGAGAGGVAYHRAWGKHYPLQAAAPQAAGKKELHLQSDGLSNADLQACLHALTKTTT